MNKEKILVTGGQGFIGSHLVDYLVANNEDVTVVDHKLSIFPEVNQKKQGLFISDFTDPILLEKVSSGYYSTVFHLAAQASVPESIANPLHYHEENVVKTLKLIQACINGKVKFIFSSSSAIYGNATKLPTKETDIHSPLSPYALNKLTIEQYCECYYKLYGFDYLALRYFNVFGPRQNPNGAYPNVISAWCKAAVQNKPLVIFGNGEQTRDFIFVEDIAEVNFLLYKKSNYQQRIFNVGSEFSYSLNQILEIFKKRFDNLKVDYQSARPGDALHTKASIEKLTDKLLFFTPSSFKESINETIDWYKKNM